MAWPYPRPIDRRLGAVIDALRGATVGLADEMPQHVRATLSRMRARSGGFNLSGRITLFYGGLLALALGLVLVASHIGITLVADHILGREFAAESRVLESIREIRYDQLQHGAEPLAADFGFRAAVASGDAPTIASALDSLKARLGIGQALLVTTDGKVIGLKVPLGFSDRAYLVDAVTGGARRGVLRLGARNYSAIAAPVKAPDVIGWVVFLRPLDAKEIDGMTQLSAIPLHGEIVPVDRLDKDVPIVSAGSSRSAERTVDGQRVLVQASLVPDFGGRRPQALALEYSLSQALAAYNPMFRILLLSSLLALGVAVAGSRYLARRLVRPLEALDQAAHRISRGEFAQVEVVGEDEIGRLTIAFNQMACDIADREKQIAEAQTRLEVQLRDVQLENNRLNAIADQLRGEALADAALNLDAQLAPLLRAFHSEADTMFEAARAMRASLTDATVRASEAGDSAQQSEEMTREIAESTGELARSGDRIAAEARTTFGMVRQAATDSQLATTSFEELRNALEHIANVTDEIRLISDRTNMLALNAAIEAARAGAAGRSFAVVAAEVKELAGQTAGLTKAIGTRLAQVERATACADDALGQVRDTLTTAGGVTERIAAAAGSQSDATGIISHGISNIAQDSRAAVSAIHRIDEAAGESVRMADDVQASAERVISRAESLRETLNMFLSQIRDAA